MVSFYATPPPCNLFKSSLLSGAAKEMTQATAVRATVMMYAILMPDMYAITIEGTCEAGKTLLISVAPVTTTFCASTSGAISASLAMRRLTNPD